MVAGLLCVNVILTGIAVAVSVKSLRLQRDRFGALDSERRSLLAEVLAARGSLGMRSQQLLGLQQRTDAQLNPQASHVEAILTLGFPTRAKADRTLRNAMEQETAFEEAKADFAAMKELRSALAA